MKIMAIVFIMALLVFVLGGLGDIWADMDLKEKAKHRKKAVFAGGCFWCVEKAFEIHEGVLEVISGYSGGKIEYPSYGDVSSGQTGHREAVQVVYDPAIISYEQLLNIFWKSIDPTDPAGQFADRGDQYTTAIYYGNEIEKEEAYKSKEDLENSGKFKEPIVTQLVPLANFYPAEEYHQDYHRKNPVHYENYYFHSGRKTFLNKTWSDSH